MVKENTSRQDYFFRQALSSKIFAAEFFKYYLPDFVIEVAAFDSLQKSSFNLASIHKISLYSDCFYQLKLQHWLESVSIITMHQSEALDPRTLDTLSKIVNQMTRDPTPNADGNLMFPFVIPLVFYTGHSPFYPSSMLTAPIESPNNLVQAYLNTKFNLINVQAMPLEDIDCDHAVGLFTYLMKFTPQDAVANKYEKALYYINKLNHPRYQRLKHHMINYIGEPETETA